MLVTAQCMLPTRKLTHKMLKGNQTSSFLSVTWYITGRQLQSVQKASVALSFTYISYLSFFFMKNLWNSWHLLFGLQIFTYENIVYTHLHCFPGWTSQIGMKLININYLTCDGHCVVT